VIGYERAAAIAKRATRGRPVFDVALEMSGLEEENCAAARSRAADHEGGLHGGGGSG
jgi:fumarate hydratase class II